MDRAARHPPFYKGLYFKVPMAIVLGVVLGVMSPSNAKVVPEWLRPAILPPLGWAEACKPLGDAFVKVIRMLIAPNIFCTVVHGIVGIVMQAAPLGAFGAMAFTIGRYGIVTLVSLGQLMASFHLTCVPFVAVALGIVAAISGFGIFKFIRYIKEELPIVLGTSSSESALPRLMGKLEDLGCEPTVVGLVVPTGYSFNLDGTCVYLTMAALFLSRATNTNLSFPQQLGVLAVLLPTSKGAAGVTGSGFIVLAATLSTVGSIPVASIALILGVDRFMSEARALTNLVGNGVARVVVSKWEGTLDSARMRAVLANPAETPGIMA